MPESYPLHGAVYGRVLMEDLARDGIKPATLLAGTGLRVDQLMEANAAVPVDGIARLFERAAELTGDELLGLHRGMRRRAQRAGALAYVGLSAPTLGNMLHNLARYSRVFSDAVHIDATHLDGKGEIRWYFDIPASIRRRQFLEFGAAGLIANARQNTNRQIALSSVRITHPRNFGIREFERFFGCPVRFGAKDNALVFKTEDLGLPLLTRDDDLLCVLQTHCHDILDRKSRRKSSLVARLERALVDRLAAGDARQDVLAADLGMSPRTLTRRLAEEGTRFQVVLDNLRYALADRYIRDSDLSRSQIAYLLGYASLSGFSSAYQRWTQHALAE